MKFLKKIPLFIYTVYAFTVFWVVAAVLIPILFLAVSFGSEKTIKWAHRIPAWVARITVFFIFIRIRQHNKELINPTKQYIFVSNHTSALDLLIPANIIHNNLKYLGKAEFLKWPAFGYALSKLYIPVQRNSKEARAKSMAKMAAILREGWASLIIYPEGTRQDETNEESRFHSGAFKLSIETGVPVAVFTTVGAIDLIGHGSLLMRPGSLDIYWEKVLDPSGYNEDQAIEMTEVAKSIILDRIASLKKNS